MFGACARDRIPVGPFELWSSFRIQVAGEFVALLVRESELSFAAQLQIWNYKRRSDRSVCVFHNIAEHSFLTLWASLDLDDPQNWHR